MISWLSFYLFSILFSIFGMVGLFMLVAVKEQYMRKIHLKMVLKNTENITLEKNEIKESSTLKEEINDMREGKELKDIPKIFEEKRGFHDVSMDKEILKMMKQAQTKIGMHEYAEAEKILIQILSYDELYREALEEISHLYLILEKPAKAIFFLEQHLSHHVPNSTIYTNYALANLHLQHFEEAVKYYGKAIDLDPSNPLRYANLGHVLLSLSHFDDGIRCFQEAIKLDPRNRDYYTIIADSLRSHHHFAESKEWYLKILSFSPYDQHALAELERLNALGF